MSNELILVVEDDPESRMLEADVLMFNGYRVLEAETAEAGLEVARREQPALILMDIRLPGMDGVAALRELRADPTTEGIPVLAVTASAMNKDRQQILAAGFDGYHGKPIDIANLLATIQNLLSSGTDSATA